MPAVCNYGYVPLSHLRNIVIRLKQQHEVYYIENCHNHDKLYSKFFDFDGKNGHGKRFKHLRMYKIPVDFNIK